MSHASRQGFSLVELSIVLVILGLLTGGILAGQSLIRAAELRAVSTEHGRFVTAAQTFRDKYFAIPGDFRDATRFWGWQSNSITDCITRSSATVNTATGVCDGDGDGSVRMNIGASPGIFSETFQFWRHLAMAGLVEGTYSGVSGANSAIHAVAANSPASRTGGYWLTGLRTNSSADEIAIFFGVTHGNMAQLGGLGIASPTAALFSPEEVWNIDTKMDDGRPGRGKVLALRYATCTTAAAGANTDFDATYLLTERGKTCAMEFPQAF